MIVVGVDGARGGWLAVALTSGRFRDARFTRSLADVVAGYPEAAAIAVDIPIGLPPPGSRRRSDEEARRLLRSRVFPTFHREVYGAAYDDVRGLGVSRQAHALGPRILEAARLEDLHEVHPELCFVELAGSVLPSKKTWAGVATRIAALESAGIAVPAAAETGTAAPDDVLDAAVAAWTAHRVALGNAYRIPRDAAPREPVIWV